MCMFILGVIVGAAGLMTAAVIYSERKSKK